MSKTILRIATRQSPLAMWQAEYVKRALQRHNPQLAIEFVKLKTKGDKILDIPLAKIGGKGLFVKELELSLLDRRADLAVHSMKDMPPQQPNGLDIAVICERDDPWDAFVSNRYADFDELPKGACVGTSSLRRQAQLKVLRPDLELVNLRGNVNTRLDKLDAGQFDAIILAAAGLKRLQCEQRIQHCFAPAQLLPAAGQGAIGIQCRNDDHALLANIQALHHPATTSCVNAERAVTKRLGASCQTPVAAYAVIHENELRLNGKVLSPDGQQVVNSTIHGSIDDAEKLGTTMAEDLLAQGAKTILDQLQL